MPHDPGVDALLAGHDPAVAAAARRVRAAVLEGHPDLTERVRPGWHSLNYRDPAAGFVCAIFPGADRVQLVFEHGVLLPDPAGLLTGSGRQVRALEFGGPDSVDAAVVQEYLDHAVEIGAGLRSRGSGRAGPPHQEPAHGGEDDAERELSDADRRGVAGEPGG